MEKEKLQAILEDSKNEIYYCFYENQFAGYFELDTHKKDEIELVYFGLAPGFIGKGLGRQLMQQVIIAAGRHQTPRLWLHTCAFDAPQALDFYLKGGFKIYRESIEDQPIIVR
jgi:GNAT superfamily N-acetyltransferase